MSTDKARPAFGAINDDETYPLALFAKLAGLGPWAMREARRKGLRTIKVGSRSFVRGRDFSEFLANKAG